MYGSNMSALLTLLALASAISAANFWATDGGVMAIGWVQYGNTLGKANENTNATMGNNLSIYA